MSSTFVRVAVNVPSSAGVFDYSVPAELAGRVGVGHLVLAPFGKQTVQGVVLSHIEQPATAYIKNILDLVDAMPVLTQIQIDLAEWLSKSTFSPIAQILDLFLPPGLSQHADTLYQIRQARDADEKSSGELSIISARLVKLLRAKGPLRGRQIDHHFGQVKWRNAAQILVKRGIFNASPVLPPTRVRPKSIRTAQLAIAPRLAEAAMQGLGQKTTHSRRQKALHYLIRVLEAVNVSWVYAESGCKLSDLQALEERGLIVLRKTEIWRDPLMRANQESFHYSIIEELTHEQRGAWETMEARFQALADGKSIKPILLQGVTGSGKTEIYIRAAREAVRRGKQAVVLVPEIALTPQTVRRFLAHFPGEVGLVHSKLSDGERYDTWRRARSGELKVVIGARSALFAPLPKPGLIVLDECHDGSYYQSEPPFYHAVKAAQTYARLAGAVCLLGSATPSIIQNYQSQRGEYDNIKLSRRVSRGETSGASDGLPPVSIVDMREELKAGQRGIFSRLLQSKLEQSLGCGEQAILFLNRRGTATYVFCRNCGQVMECPRCATPLTLHVENKEKLLCHRCGYERNLPQNCPECKSSTIRAYGLGTERVEKEILALFPKVRTLRWDWETTRQKEAHEIILTHFAAHRADVLIGTQMLAKGLDLPLVTLVGIVLADVGLYLPDPFAAERVFQVLTHVSGRAGRGERQGQVILQTFNPEHPVIQSAALQDVNGFYRRELEERKRLGYPPFTQMVRFEYRDHDPVKAEKAARTLAENLDHRLTQVDKKNYSIIGPVPCFHSKLNGQYRWQIILRGPDPAALVRGNLPQHWRIEVEPINLL